MAGGTLQDDLVFLLLYWVAVGISAFLAKYTRLSPLVYYLVFGMVLSNTHLVHSTDFLQAFTEVGITVVFFALGLEENMQHFIEGVRKAWGIASIGAIVPFLVGFGCTLLFWSESDIKVALMGGLAVTATAVSLTMISLKAEGLASSKPAIGIMTSAVLDDIASLALVAICTPIATGEAEPTPQGIAWIMGKAALFFVCVAFAYAVVFPHNVETGPVSHIPFVRKYGIRDVLCFQHGEQATFISLLIGLFFGLVAIWWGFHQTIGAYMAGLILEERFYDLDEEETAAKDIEGDKAEDGEPDPLPNTYQHTLYTIEDAAFCWLGPVFFVHLGASIPIDSKVISETIGYSLIFFVLLFVGQFLSASIAARYVPGGFTWAESIMIGFGMLGRAELFFVVLNLSYRRGILNTAQFFTFTTTALLLDICVPICITCYKPYFVKFSQITVTPASSEPKEDNEVVSVMSIQSRTEAIRNFIHRKLHRQTMKRERRIFKPEIDANGQPRGRISSKNSVRSIECIREVGSPGRNRCDSSKLSVTSLGGARNSGMNFEAILPGMPETGSTKH